jgi:hypothetical protein
MIAKSNKSFFKSETVKISKFSPVACFCFIFSAMVLMTAEYIFSCISMVLCAGENLNIYDSERSIFSHLGWFML